MDSKTAEIERLMLARYGLCRNDYIILDVSGETAEEWVKWYAEKHDLTEIK